MLPPGPSHLRDPMPLVAGWAGQDVLSAYRLHGENPAPCRGNSITNSVRAGAPQALEGNKRCQCVPLSPVPS